MNPSPLIDPSKFPPDWIRVRGFVPTDPACSLVGRVRRKLIAEAFPSDRFHQLRWSTLGPHERWVASVTRWVKNTHAALAAFDGKETELFVRRLKAMQLCRPVGYRGDPMRGKVGTRCNNWLCPWCHARRGAEAFYSLKAAYLMAPKDRPVYAGQLVDDSARGLTDPGKTIRKRKVAGGVGFRYPVKVRDGEVVWGFKLVVIADDPRGVEGLPHFPLTGVGGAALAVSRWLTYPKAWSSASRRKPDPAFSRTLRLAVLTEREHTTVRYGACRNGHDSTKSAMGFKLSAAQIASLTGKDTPCPLPQESPSSGSSGTPCSTSPSSPRPSGRRPRTPPPPS